MKGSDIDPSCDGVIMLSDDEVFFKKANERLDGRYVFHVYEWTPYNIDPNSADRNDEDDIFQQELFAKADNSSIDIIKNCLEQFGVHYDDWCPPISHLGNNDDSLYENMEIKLDFGEKVEKIHSINGTMLDPSPNCFYGYEKIMYLCLLCSKSYGYKANAYTHIRRKHKEVLHDSKPVSFVRHKPFLNQLFSGRNNCFYCVFSCVTKKCLQNHFQLCHENLDLKFELSPVYILLKCKLCKMNSEERQHVLKHIETSHAKVLEKKQLKSVIFCETLLRCLVCGSPIENKNEMRNHLVQSHFHLLYRLLKKNGLDLLKNFPSLYSCNLCPFSTEEKTNLISHIEENHTEYRKKHTQKGVKDEKPKKITKTVVEKEEKRSFKTTGHPTSSKKFFCKKCSFTSYSWNVICRHVKIKHFHSRKRFDASKKNLYRCKYCSLTTKYIYSYERHMFMAHKKTIPSLKKYKCKKCKYITVDRHKYKSHKCIEKVADAKREKAPIDSLYRCSVCPYRSYNRFLYVRHTLVHRKSHLYRCLICCYSTNYKFRIANHVLNHKDHLNTGKELWEFNNDKPDHSLPPLKAHGTNRIEDAPVDVKLKKLKIVVQKLNFGSSKSAQVLFYDGLETLFRLVSPLGPSIRVMPKLTEFLRSQRNITKFMLEMQKEKTSIEQENKSKTIDQLGFSCKTCDFKTRDKEALWDHLKEVHPLLNIYHCQVCTFVADSLHKLNVHMRFHREDMPRSSTSRKKWQCELCGYSTSDKNLKHQHELTHSEVKSMKCDQCSFATNFKGNLVKHVITHI